MSIRRGLVICCHTRTSIPWTVMSPKRKLRLLLRPSSRSKRIVPNASHLVPSGRALIWMRSGSRTCCQTRTSTSVVPPAACPGWAPAAPTPATSASATTRAPRSPRESAGPRFTERGLLPGGGDTLAPSPTICPIRRTENRPGKALGVTTDICVPGRDRSLARGSSPAPGTLEPTSRTSPAAPAAGSASRREGSRSRLPGCLRGRAWAGRSRAGWGRPPAP